MDGEQQARPAGSRDAGQSESNFTRLLVALFLFLLAVPVIGVLQAAAGRTFAGLIVEGVFAFTLVSAALAVTTKVVHRRATVALAIVGAALSWISYQTDSHSLGLIKDLWLIVFLGNVIALVMRYLFRQRGVTHNMVAASLCGYVLIGVLWAFAYSVVFEIQAGSFKLAAVQEDLRFSGRDSVTALYYSFVTLTTLGFGDVTPESGAARMLTVVEALVGQIYLVVIVSRLVALSAADSRQDRH